MVKVCCVRNCDNRSTRESDRRYFPLPGGAKAARGKGDGEGGRSTDSSLALSRRYKWIEAIRGPTDDPLEVDDHSRVCSDHFHSGVPADDEDLNHVDWIPTLKMGHSAEGFDADEGEDVKSRWPNWEIFVKRIMVFLKTGIHEEELTRSEQKAIQKAAKTYYLEGGILFHQRSKKPLRVVMLESEHREIIRQFHIMETGIHSGINATVDRITSKYFWRGIKQDVVQYISQCCGRHKDSVKPSTVKTQGDELLPDGSQANVAKGRTGASAIQTSPSAVSSRKSLEESAMRLLEEYSQQLRADRSRVSSLKPPDQDTSGHEDLQSSIRQSARDDDITILDEIEEDEKHSTDIVGMTFNTKNNRDSDGVIDLSKTPTPDNMAATTTMLEMMNTASKEKAVNQAMKSSSGKPKPKPVKPDTHVLPKPLTSAVAKPPTTSETDPQSSAKHYRSFAWSLHNIGLRLVRQQVYKNLVEIQEVKNEQNRLDESEKKQLEKLKGYYLDLRQKNRYLMSRGRRCRCGYRVGSMQELDLHQEYGHGWESSRYDCCLCKFTSKAFSIFSSHMTKEHGRKARFHLPLAPFVCPYCPFEHRHNTKKKLLRHVANCERNFQLDCNLAVRAIDADIPLLAPPKSAATAVTANSGTIGTASSGNKVQDTSSPSVLRNQRSVKSIADAGALQTSVGGLQSKMLQQPVPRYEICEICGGFVRDRGSLIIHMKYAHKIDIHPMCKNNSAAPIECKLCSERFWTVQSLNTHVSVLHGEVRDASQSSNLTISVCPLCKRTRLTDVMSHLAQQHRVTLLDMFMVRYCALCLLELHSEKAFEDHMTTCHSSLYPSRGALLESIRLLEQQRLSSSSRPSALLLALVNRNKHTWKFNSSPRNPLQMYSCPICRCQFGSLDDLTSHFEQFHSHKCHQCEYRCGSAELLRRHFRSEHDGAERCPICGMEVAAGDATVAHFEEHHLMSCSITLSRSVASSEIETDKGVNVLASDVKRRHPSSLSDGSNEGSIYEDDDDDEEEEEKEGEKPMLKRVRLEAGNAGCGDI